MASGLSVLLLAAIVCLCLGASTYASGEHEATPTLNSPDWDPACYRTNDQALTFLQGSPPLTLNSLP